MTAQSIASTVSLDVEAVEQRLDYRFRRAPQLLQQALTHASKRSTERDLDRSETNERLEFLGDTVLSMVVTDYLYRALPRLNEGELTVRRASLVSRVACAEYFFYLQLTPYLQLGNIGEAEQARVLQQTSVLAGAFEALLGAIYLDGGVEAARTFLLHHFEDVIRQKLRAATGNHKALLQKWAQVHGDEVVSAPVYDLVQRSGPPHATQFRVRARLRVRGEPGERAGIGVGTSKRKAEQSAALALLTEHGMLHDVDDGVVPLSGTEEGEDIVEGGTQEVTAMTTAEMVSPRAAPPPSAGEPEEGSPVVEPVPRYPDVEAVRRSDALELVLSRAHGGQQAGLEAVCRALERRFSFAAAVGCFTHLALMGAAHECPGLLPRPLRDQLTWATVLHRHLVALVDDTSVRVERVALRSGQYMLRVQSADVHDTQRDVASVPGHVPGWCLGAESAHFFLVRQVVVPQSDKVRIVDGRVHFDACLVPPVNDLGEAFLNAPVTQTWLAALLATTALLDDAEDSWHRRVSREQGRLVLHDALQRWTREADALSATFVQQACAWVLFAGSDREGATAEERRNVRPDFRALQHFARLWLPRATADP
ncbi:hypothetical protein CDCA_CDCA02G0758 [Cyanidium caldarium]|uniref:ribonuclease III n=1 Tax=Cyanidium caldarium TaxID=2771 RepID=A0AAV9IR49_CYACA|nr:hypothetical protein CDCA_CDCA02G0758 [Cyanidium caldarium]